MPDLCIYSRDCVERHFTFDVAIPAMAQAARAISSGADACPSRCSVTVSQSGGQMLVMPGSAKSLDYYGIKTLSIEPGNRSTERPVIQGFIALFDRATGAPRALIDGAVITAVRTAAASAVTTDCLARPDVRSHGILGTGVQAKQHAISIPHVRPGIERTVIWGRDSAKAEGLAAHLSAELQATVEAGTQDDVLGCDIVSAVTASSTPVVHKDKLSTGAHINLVGSHTPDAREACSDTMATGRIYVDSRAAALCEAGDLLIPIAEGAITDADIHGEIGSVLSGEGGGRTSGEDITIYKSLGNALQDLFGACALVEAAGDDAVKVAFS
ncbi:MAG: ornithine cyclodeaminase family protein [Pseudomonadota bacterium]